LFTCDACLLPDRATQQHPVYQSFDANQSKANHLSVCTRGGVRVSIDAWGGGGQKQTPPQVLTKQNSNLAMMLFALLVQKPN
jgi:hypothetical protein